MNWRRRLTQLLSALVSNSYLPGWLRGTIYQGKLKTICVPFLNCYSCPGALGSCPVGAWQSLAAGFGRTVAWYVLGCLLAVGALAGRWVCGWLCPFGLVQELLFRLTKWRWRIPRWLTRLKYLVLLLTAGLPFYWRSAVGLAEPYFCKYVCPAGTLLGGLPLISTNPGLRSLVGWLFGWKLLLLLGLLLWALVSWRPFCRTLCPLGAFYGLLNRWSIWRLRLQPAACTGCAACQRQCPADLSPQVSPNQAECVRCLQCVNACPRGALHWSPTVKTPNAACSDRRSARPVGPGR